MTDTASEIHRSGGGVMPDSAPSLTAAAVATLTGGELSGDGACVVHGVAPIDRAGEGHLSFVSSPKYLSFLSTSTASVVLLPPELAQAPAAAVRARVVVAQPHEAMMGLLGRFHQPVRRDPGIDPTARIGHGVRIGAQVSIEAGVIVGANAIIGDRVWLGAHSVVGDGVEIGDDCQVFSQVTLYPRTSLGRRVLVHSGARLGCDGFGYVFRNGAHEKVPHVGRCVIGDDVEIGANSTIDRGSVDDTVIGSGTKIDNLVHVGHNCRVGRLCLLMAQVGIAGSAHVGDGVILAGQVGVGGHLSIGAGARIGGQGGVVGNVPPGATWSGTPARSHQEFMRAQAALRKLSGMIRQVERLVEEREPK